MGMADHESMIPSNVNRFRTLAVLAQQVDSHDISL